MKEHYKKESPFVSLLGLGGGGTGLAFGGVAGPKTYVDDVFSTYVYEGDGTNNDSKAITTGLDIANDGGLIWIKSREASGAGDDHILVSPGLTGYIRSNTTNPLTGNSGDLAVPTATGFTVNTKNSGGTWYYTNASSKEYVSWNFKAAPGFLDVVTYTGNGVAGRQISHALGSTPGMVIVKRTNGADNWTVQHRSLGGTKSLYLNLTNSQDTSSTEWNNTAATSTVFTVGTSGKTNANGDTYVAYIFAHEDQSFGTGGNESIIKCGTYTGNGSTQEINLGFEPQWFLTKRSTGSDFYGWQLYDNMRGMPDGGADAYLRANLSSAELTYDDVDPTPTGLTVKSGSGGANASGATYIYMAIRRPNKPPEAAINVFSVNTTTNDNNFNTTGFPVDFAIAANTNHTYGNSIGSRLQGQKPMFTNTTASEAGWLTANTWTSNTSFRFAYAGNGYNYVNYAFKRAPGFMDVVAYTGDGTYDGSYSVNHNLEVVPEMIIAKNRGSTNFWNVYHSGLTSDTYQINLNRDAAQLNTGQSWGPAAASFKPQYAGNSDYSSNHSGQNYVAYLFATLPGISKVGSYTGTGGPINVDCGFTNGSRFVLVKRTDSSGDWFVWDKTRGIDSFQDPYLLLNNANAQVTNTDYINPHNSGFTIDPNSLAPVGVNANGGTYVFLAIA